MTPHHKDSKDLHKRILEYKRKHPTAELSEFVLEFGVSKDTIRRVLTRAGYIKVDRSFPRTDKEMLARVKSMRKKGATFAEIAVAVGRTEQTISAIFHKMYGSKP